MPTRETGVHQRPESNVYQWRIKAPKELRHLYKSEWAHRQSLGTTDLRAANAKAAELRAKWLATFERQAAHRTVRKVDEFTPELIKLFSDFFIHRKLLGDERRRTDPAHYAPVVRDFRKLGLIPDGPPIEDSGFKSPMPVELSEYLADLHQRFDNGAAKKLARGDLSCAFEDARFLAEKLAIEFHDNTPGLRELLVALNKAERTGAALLVKRDLGEVVDTPPPPAPEQRQQAMATTLRDVFHLWKGTKKRTAGSLRACELAVQMYEDRTKNTPVAKLTRAQGDDFRSWLQTLGSASKTAHDRITWVKTLLGYAYRDLELIKRQPWEGIDIEHKTENRRKPWTGDQIAAYFAQPIYSTYELPTAPRSGADAAYWIPLLGLYTGSRVSELAQLRVVDVDLKAAIPTIRITDEADGQKVKSEAGERLIPIHSELVRLGFLDYVKATGDEGHDALFPRLRLRKDKPGGYFSEWFGENKPEGSPDFHSFRHTVRSVMAAAKVQEQVMDRITGHAVKGSTGTKVYTHVNIELLKEAVETIRYPALQLQRVYGL